LKKMWFSPAEKTIYEIKNGDLLVVEGGAGEAAIVQISNGEKDIFKIQFTYYVQALT